MGVRSTQPLVVAAPSRAARGLFVVTLLAYGLYAALESNMAVDLWMAMACGRVIVEGRSLPAGDVFSYTYAGAPWFNGEWLAQVLLFTLFRHGEGLALALYKMTIVVACVLLAGWIAWRRCGSFILSAVPIALAALVCRPYFDIRPELFLYLGTLGVMAVVESYRRGRHPAILVLPPAIFALWVNLHFSFIYGLGVLLLLVASEIGTATLGRPHAIDRSRGTRWLGAAAAASAVACLLNPYGVRALVFPFIVLDSGTDWRTGVTEWLPPVFFQEQAFNPALFGYYFVAQCGLLALTLIMNPRRVELGSALHVVVTAAMALSARRFVPLFALVSAPFAAANLVALRDGLARRGWSLATGPIVARLPATLCVVGLTYALVLLGRDVRQYRAAGLFAGLTVADYFPAGAVEFLNRNALPSRLFHLYSWGGYVMYWAPGHKVFIDGRAHLVYPGAFYREQKTAEFGSRGWADVLDRRQVSLVLWPSYRTAGGAYRTVLDSLGTSPQWRRVYDDGHSAVFAHVERGRTWVEAFERFTLTYPDNPGALFFEADARLAAHRFAEARELMRRGIERVAGRPPAASAAEGRLGESARSTNAPLLWFQLAFFRDVRDDAPGAVDAYAQSLAHGLPEPHAGWAREAIARLRSSERTAP